MLQVTQHAGHTLEPTETISNKELVDVLNLGSRWDQPLQCLTY